MNITEIAKKIAEKHYPNLPTAPCDNAYRDGRINELQKLIESELKNLRLGFVVESAELEANDEQGTPIVDEDGTMTCNCAEPKQSAFPNGKWICIKCWGEWYH
jgi:hypothetical protein